MLNGAPVGTEDTAAPYNVSWTSTAVPNGPYQLTAVARDAAGNRRTSAAITVAVANEVGNGVIGDFNGDGKPDLLFAHSKARALYTWFMDGSRTVGGGYLSPDETPLGWVVAAVDDFNGDRKSDMIIQHTSTGQVRLWAMDGVTRIDDVMLLPGGTAWRVAASADLNADGKADLLWRLPATGEIYAWLMNGPNVAQEGLLTPSAVDPRWRIAGTADLNGDRYSDILWQHDNTGELVVWYMSGLSATASGNLNPPKVQSQWRIRALADFDGDGKADIVWQHDKGDQVMWFMDGINLLRMEFLAPVETVWQMVGGR